MKELSVLAPIKITHQRQFDLFIRCLNRYENLLQNQNVEFLVANESIAVFKTLVNEAIYNITNKAVFINGVGIVSSLKKLIKESNAKYTMFFLDDVELLFDPNIEILDCIMAMEHDEKIIQVKYGGGKIYSSTQSQIENFKTTHTPVAVNNSVIWLNETKNENPSYLISQWNSVIRSSVIKMLSEKINQPIKSWDQFAAECSHVYTNGSWDTKTGWLNLKNGLYAWGRNSDPFDNINVFR